MKKALLPLAALLLASASNAAPSGAPFTVLETGEGYWTIQEAVNGVGSGIGTIAIAPGTYRQCAVQEAGRITYRATVPGQVIFEKETCEEKGGFVTRGQFARFEGIIFQDYKVPDFNGAGIRQERGDLEVFNATFKRSEQGILSNNDPKGSIFIDRSTFTELGNCPNDERCSHSVYINRYGKAVVTNSRFEKGRAGHYLKSRAAIDIFKNNSFDDSQGSHTNYHIDMPEGATGEVSGNMFVQGKNKDNYSAIIALGAETVMRPSDGLVVANNDARFAPGAENTTVFLADWQGARVVQTGNKIAPGLKAYERR